MRRSKNEGRSRPTGNKAMLFGHLYHYVRKPINRGFRKSLLAKNADED